MPDDAATFGTPNPPRRGPRWTIVVALLIIAGLGAVFAWNWPSREETARAVDPEAHGRAAGTGGDRVPGATSGAASSVDRRPFPAPETWDATTPVAMVDSQPLYLASKAPERIPDANMVIEATTDEGKVGGGYHLYIPKDSASGANVSARFYYLRTGPDQYIKVSPKGGSQ
jgi:hypothetical protein